MYLGVRTIDFRKFDDRGKGEIRFESSLAGLGADGRYLLHARVTESGKDVHTVERFRKGVTLGPL